MQAGGDFDPNFDRKVRKVAEKISENVHGILNEPSLGMYRIHEHVRKSMPILVGKKLETAQQLRQLQSACYDMELTAAATKNLIESKPHFGRIHELMKNSIFLAQQIQYEKTRSLNADLQKQRHHHTTAAARHHGVSGSVSVDIPDRSRPAGMKSSRTINSLQPEHRSSSIPARSPSQDQLASRRPAPAEQ